MKIDFESPQKEYSNQELIAKNKKSLVKLGTNILNIFNDNNNVN
jgi:hypothetical protein